MRAGFNKKIICKEKEKIGDAHNRLRPGVCFHDKG